MCEIVSNLQMFRFSLTSSVLLFVSGWHHPAEYLLDFAVALDHDTSTRLRDPRFVQGHAPQQIGGEASCQPAAVLERSRGHNFSTITLDYSYVLGWSGLDINCHAQSTLKSRQVHLCSLPCGIPVIDSESFTPRHRRRHRRLSPVSMLHPYCTFAVDTVQRREGRSTKHRY